MPEFRISKEECEKKIKGVCEGCGGPLSAMETVDNADNPTHWIGCEKCRCFRSGVPIKIFKVARKLVESGSILPYRSMSKCDYEKTPEALAYFYAAQTAGLSQHITEIVFLLKEMEDQDHDGKS
jgi:hypothetical protein